MRYIHTACVVVVAAVFSAHARVAQAQSCITANNPQPTCDNAVNGYYSTVSGGIYNTVGYSGGTNSNYSTIAGGGANNISPGSASCTISGGAHNAVEAAGYGNDTIGGGYSNYIFADYATIAGGYENTVEPGNYSTIAGGYQNSVNGSDSVIAGGASNAVSSYNVFVGGGLSNTANGAYATIAGGASNSVSFASGGSYSFIGGGSSSAVEDGSTYSVIAGGEYNRVGSDGNNTTANYSFIGGGNSNTVDVNPYGTVAGGYGNTVTGTYGAVPGGELNAAKGTASFAAGTWADADQNGCFVWSDSTAASPQHCVYDNGGTLTANSSAANSFVVRATGGVVFITGSSSWISANANQAYWSYSSDRNKKHGFQDVDTRDVLRRVVSMPVTTWAYNSDDNARHIGPMAQDFHAAFPLSDDDTHVNSIDESGAAFAAIQGVYAEVLERDETISALRKANAEANLRVASLEKRLEAIEAQLGLKR